MLTKAPTIVSTFLTLALLLVAGVPRFTGAETRAAETATGTAPTCADILSVTPQGPITIEWTAQSTKRIEIASNDTKERNLRLTLGDLGLKDLGGNTLDTTALIQVQPPISPVKAGHALQVTIIVKETPAVRPGVYVGSLMLALDGDNEPKSCAKRLTVQLTVPDAELLADQVTLRQYRLLPGPLPFRFVGCFWSDCVVRFRGPVTSLTGSLPRGTPLGLLQNEQGHTATVYRADQKPVVLDGVVELPLDVRGQAFAGKYEGQLRFNPSSEKAGNAQLSLVVTDWFLWPMLVIALSMWLGLRVQRYLNVERSLWRLRGQEAALGVAFQESQRKFIETATGTPYAAYSISDDLASSRKRLRENLNSLRTATGTTLDPADPGYKGVLDEFESLRKHVAAWNGFADELAALQRALGDESDLGDQPSAYEEELPTLFATYEALLVGENLTLVKFAERREQVREAAKAAGLWYALKARLDRGEERHASLQQSATNMSEDEKKQLAELWKSLLKTRLALWEANDIADVEALSADTETLATADASLRKLAAKYLSPQPIGAGLAVAHVLATRGNLALMAKGFGLGAGPDDEPADDAERARYYAAAINTWDRKLTLLAFVIATLTALNNLYLGKPFGTLKDYIGLILLGLGTKLTVDTVSAAVGWVFGRAPLDQFRRRT